MKKRSLLLALSAGMSYVILSANATGSALASSEIRNGAYGSLITCAGGCHSNTLALAAPVINIRVDTAGGIEVTRYTPGITYTVTVSGSHSSLDRFGLQYAAVSGTGSAQVAAGSFSGLPSGIAQRTPGGRVLLEQSSAITGGTSFTRSFSWTAPATNVGNITMYLTVNAVNGDFATSGDVSANVTKLLTAYTPASVSNVANDISITTFPNPVTDILHIRPANIFGSYAIQAFDISGRSVLNTTVNGMATIGTTTWAPGTYNLIITGNNTRRALQIVKQ